MRILLLTLIATALWSSYPYVKPPSYEQLQQLQKVADTFSNAETKEDSTALSTNHKESYDVESMKVNTNNLMKMIDDSVNSIPGSLNCMLSVTSIESKVGENIAIVQTEKKCHPNLSQIIAIPGVTEISNKYIKYSINQNRNDIFVNIVLQHLQKRLSKPNITIGFDNLNGVESKYIKNIRYLSVANYENYSLIAPDDYYGDEEKFQIPLEDLKNLKHQPFIKINGFKFTKKSSESNSDYLTLADKMNSKKIKTIKYLKHIDEKYFNHLDQYVTCEFNKQEVGQVDGNGLINVEIPYTCKSNDDFKNALNFNQSDIDESYVKRYFIRAAEKSFVEIQLPAYNTKLRSPIFYLFSGTWGVPNNDKEYVLKGLQTKVNSVSYKVDYNSLRDIQSVQSNVYGTTRNDHLIENIETMTQAEVDAAVKKIRGNIFGAYAMFYQGGDVFTRISKFNKCQENYTKGKKFTSQQQIADQLAKQCLKK